MRSLIGLLTLALFPAASAAADPPAFQVPKTWEKVDVGGAPAAFLTGRDGYAVRIDAVLVEATAQFRAQSFTRTLYRYKLGDKEPERLDRRTTTHTTVALLGPGGAVATGYFANCDTIHLPGHKPLPLPKELRYAAHHFTKDGLVLTTDKYFDNQSNAAIVYFPIDREKGEFGTAKFLRSWFPATGKDGFNPDFHHGRVLLRGDFVAYTGTVPDPTRRIGFTKNVTEVWDARNEKVVWRQDYAALAAADDAHAYWTVGADVARRALNGKAKAEQLVLPKDAVRFDIQPPFVLALVNRDKEWALTRYDLATGEAAEYDLRVPDDGRRVDFWGGQLPLGFDATGEVRALWKQALYKVPLTKRAGAKLKWEPLAEEK